MGKGSAPSAPPDYSSQKDAFRANTERGYQRQAGTYNALVDNYNTALGGAYNKLGTLSSDVGNLTYSDLYDNPLTPENENPYSSLRSRATNLSNELSSLNAPSGRPTFSSTVQSPYGAVGITNIPTLNTPYEDAQSRYLNEVTGISTKLSDLMEDRRNEENRINQFRTQSLGDLSGFSTSLGQMGIADLNRMNQLERDLGSFDVGQQLFSSPILDQMYPEGFSQIGSQYTGLMEGLADLRGQREQELGRIDQYGRNLYQDLGQYRNTLGDLTIADAPGMLNLRRDLEERQRDLGRFSSELDFDFGQQSRELSGLLSDLGQLESDRDFESSRIDNATRDFIRAARGIEDAAESGSIYNSVDIDAIEDALRDTRTDIGRFSSVLPFDFSDATGVLNEADAALLGLRARRTGALDAIRDEIIDTSSGISGLENYDEAGMLDVASQLRGIQGDLNRFSGDRVDEIASQLTDATNQIDGRLQELSNARGALETRAQDLLTQINNAQYYGVGDLGGDRASFDTLQAEIELYNAQQALDEINAAETRLNSERQRLERDAEAVAERDRIARDAILSAVGASGVPEFENFDQIDPVTLGQYLALLQSQEEEEFANQIAPSAFAQNVLRA